MPPKDYNISNPKPYMNGKEIPFIVNNIKIMTDFNDNEDSSIHFNPEKETSLTFESCKFSSKQFSKLFGIWEKLKWHQKLRIIISDWFKLLNK
jgi:hypothetical protein